MRMLDTEGDRSVRQLQLYLTLREAQELRAALDRLLGDPEATSTSMSLRRTPRASSRYPSSRPQSCAT